MDEILNEINRKLERTNVTTCPIRKNIIISHNTERTKCSHASCMLYDHDDENCCMKSRIFRQKKKKLSYSFDELLRL